MYTDMVIRQARLTHVVLYMKNPSNQFAISGVIIMLLLVITCFANLLIVDDERQVAQRIAQLHPQVQGAIKAYRHNQPKLRVGDLVEVRDLDDLESTRMFAVDQVVHDQVCLKDYRSPEGETMVLGADDRTAISMTEKYSFRFIRQSDLAWQPIANWYWIQ